MRHSVRMLIFLSGLSIAATTNAVSAATQRPYLAGLRRLTETQYRNSIADIFGPNIVVQGKFEPDRRVAGLLAAGSGILSITPSGFEAYAKMADSIAKQVVRRKKPFEIAALHAKIRHVA